MPASSESVDPSLLAACISARLSYSSIVLISLCCVLWLLCQGTSVSQDARFSDKQRSLLATLSFPAVYSEKLSAADLQRVQLAVLTPWIHATVAALLGFEDDVVSSLVVNMLQQQRESKQSLDPRELQLTLTGFLEQAAPTFVEALWRLLISAAREQSGIPQQLVDSKVREIQQQQRLSANSSSDSSSKPSSGNTSTSSSSSANSSSSNSQHPHPAADDGTASSSSSSSSLSTSSAVVSSAASAIVPSSRSQRAKSRFGPPLTQQQKAATAATASAATSTSITTQPGVKQTADDDSTAATDNPTVKRQRIAR